MRSRTSEVEELRRSYLSISSLEQKCRALNEEIDRLLRINKDLESDCQSYKMKYVDYNV